MSGPGPWLILASGSPRRRELLARLGLPFDVIPSDADETADPGLAPDELVARLAERKARAVAATVERRLVIGADTAVVLDGAVLGKPRDPADAGRMLRRLRDREHHVVTGVAIVDAATGRAERSAVRSVVRMRPYRDDEIDRYVATGEPMDKAGGYGIQAGGGRLVAAVDGCFNNVVGLPLCEAAALLTRLEVSLELPGPVCTLPTGAPCPRLTGDRASEPVG